MKNTAPLKNIESLILLISASLMVALIFNCIHVSGSSKVSIEPTSLTSYHHDISSSYYISDQKSGTHHFYSDFFDIENIEDEDKKDYKDVFGNSYVDTRQTSLKYYDWRQNTYLPTHCKYYIFYCRLKIPTILV